MAVTLDKLYISIEEKYNMKLVAGKDGLKNVIRWVHMVEDSEVPNFLHGNELIFTTGIGRLDTADKILEFVQGLQKHNAAGLVSYCVYRYLVFGCHSGRSSSVCGKLAAYG